MRVLKRRSIFFIYPNKTALRKLYTRLALRSRALHHRCAKLFCFRVQHIRDIIYTDSAAGQLLAVKGKQGRLMRDIEATFATHWTLDIVFREDESRTRIGHAQKNLARVRKLALALLRKEKTAKGGMKARRLQAGRSQEYLLNILAAGP